MLETIEIQCVINDALDVCIQIRHKNDVIEGVTPERQRVLPSTTFFNTIYFYESMLSKDGVDVKGNDGAENKRNDETESKSNEATESKVNSTSDLYVASDHKFT